MNARDMVRELVDKWGYKPYQLFKEGLASQTMIYQLYKGQRGDCTRPATIAHILSHYKRLKKAAKAKGKA